MQLSQEVISRYTVISSRCLCMPEVPGYVTQIPVGHWIVYFGVFKDCYMGEVFLDVMKINFCFDDPVKTSHFSSIG